MVTTIEAGTSLTVKEYRQVQGAKKVAELMSSVDKKEMKDFSPSVNLHSLLEETCCSSHYLVAARQCCVEQSEKKILN